LIKDGLRTNEAKEGETVTILLNQTPFYAESGGQVGDAGKLSSLLGFEGIVEDTSKPLGKLHALLTKVVKGAVNVGDVLQQKVDVERRTATRANHSATHLLHAALRRRLGEHVTQKGSLVAPDRLRFDFSHPKALTSEEIAAIEADVNAEIRANEPVVTRLMTRMRRLRLARSPYSERSTATKFACCRWAASAKNIIRSSCAAAPMSPRPAISPSSRSSRKAAVSSGVRRIEALTGESARQWLNARDEKLREAASALKASPEEVPARVAALVENARKLERELAEARKALAMGGGAKTEAAGPEDVGGRAFLGQVVEGLDPKSLRGEIDALKQRLGSGCRGASRRQ
jgi:alanyl-tRNA synthetase